jgi:hypothetical protein
MTVQTGRNELASATRRRLVVLGLLRALATAVVLVALYYLLPLDHITSVPLGSAGGLLILLAVIACQLRAIVRAKEPAVRAVVALASTVPLFIWAVQRGRQQTSPATGPGIAPEPPRQHGDGMRRSMPSATRTSHTTWPGWATGSTPKVS